MRKIMNDDSVTNVEETKVIKPKRQISDAQREHLNKIRELAMKKKAELKEITLKSKLAKTVPKQELAKQYDEYVENKVKEKTQTKKAKTRARLWKALEHSKFFPAKQSTTQVNLLFFLFFPYLRKHWTVSNKTKTNKLP